MGTEIEALKTERQAVEALLSEGTNASTEALKAHGLAGLQAYDQVLAALQGQLEALVGERCKINPRQQTRKRDALGGEGNIPLLLRTQVMRGSDLPLEYFKVCVLNVRVMGDWLLFSHSLSLAKEKKRVPTDLYITILREQGKALETLYNYFPILPHFPVAVIREGNLSSPQIRIRALLMLFSIPPVAAPRKQYSKPRKRFPSLPR